MINFSLGFVAGAAAAVMSPWVFNYVADKIAQVKAYFNR